MVFDILAPFYNLLNTRATYSRFDSHFCPTADDVTIYDFASQQKWSLLNFIQRKNGRNANDYDDEKHASLSDIVIRNAEVLSALMELIRVNRFKGYSSLNVKCIEEFYDSIRNSRMRTYPRSHDERPYEISFSFLSAFHDLLEECNQDDFDKELFPSQSYAQSTILNTLSTALKDVYKKLSRQEWKQLFPKDQRHKRDHIIEIINQTQRN